MISQFLRLLCLVSIRKAAGSAISSGIDFAIYEAMLAPRPDFCLTNDIARRLFDGAHHTRKEPFNKFYNAKWTHLLFTMVETNSHAHNREGVNFIQKMIEEQLRRVGFKISQIKNPLSQNLSGNLLVGELPGLSGNFITFLCHADTVFSENSSHKVRIEGRKAFGPGIIDDKGGAIIALKGLEDFLKTSKKRELGLRFISCPNEEQGSTGFHKIFGELAKDTQIVLGFEPADEIGNVISGRKGNRWYDINVKGKAAHSGRDYHLGVNACAELATQLVALQKLTEYEKGITVNIGKIEGGTAYNTVSEIAYGQLDVRFPCQATKKAIVQKIEGHLSKSHIHNLDRSSSSKIEFQVVDDCPPFAPNEDSNKIFQIYQKQICSIENRIVSSKSVGGAADCNYFSNGNKVVLDGLGAVGGNMHTADEFIILDSLESRSQALTGLLHEIENGGWQK